MTTASALIDVDFAPAPLARRFQHEIGMPWRAALRQTRVLQAIEL